MKRLLLLALLLPALAPGLAAQPAARPNLILLFADDLGYGDLSSYGHPTIRTPHLDRLGAEGIRLTSFYAAAPACTPSRAALLTGRYPLRAGLPHVLGPDSENGLPASEITLAEVVKAVGYRTMMVGKWHLGHARPEMLPTANGFDHYFGLLYSNDMMPPWVQTDRPLELFRDDVPIEHPVEQTTLTRRYTEEAVRFIESAGDAPFFLYLAYSMPHLPVFAPPELQGRSRGEHYGDVIETIDWSAGRILETLQAQGLDENTLVVFTSDNGPWLNLPERMLQEGNRPWHVGSAGLLRGAKQDTYEGGMRVPGLVRWPAAVPPGRTSAEIATTMDLFTTLVAAAGAALPADRPIDGNDLLPFLKGETDTSPTQTFYYFRGRQLEAVREGPWKLRRSNHRRPDAAPDATPTAELFHLDRDPSERYNVAGEHPDLVRRLHAQMRQFASEIEGAEAP